jgi:hypothetical protein
MSFGHGALSARPPLDQKLGMELGILKFRFWRTNVPENSLNNDNTWP